jgi:hypothetical protein
LLVSCSKIGAGNDVLSQQIKAREEVQFHYLNQNQVTATKRKQALSSHGMGLDRRCQNLPELQEETRERTKKNKGSASALLTCRWLQLQNGQ